LEDAIISNQWVSEGNEWNPYLGEDISAQGGMVVGQVQSCTSSIKAGFDIALPAVKFTVTFCFEAGDSNPTFHYTTHQSDPSKHYLLKISSYAEGNAATLNITILCA
jgi:hypothetical protein